MKSRRVLIILFCVLSGAMLAIGRFYDHRLEFFGINVTVVLSSLYCIVMYYMISLFGRSQLNLLKILQYIFFFITVSFTIVLWLFYDVQDYGINKLLDFILITVPISIVITEVFRRKDIDILLYILFAISLFLLTVSLFNVSELILNRTGVMGGGPIVLSRWLGMGALIVFFYNPLKKYRIILFPLFIMIALLTGSRGPFYSIIIVMIFYMYFNFRRVFWKSFFAISLIVSLFFISGTHKQLLEIRTVSRVFMNIQSGGYAQSTQGRSVLIQTSVDQIIEYPFGVGFGNWQKFSNKKNYLVGHTPPLVYPHNIILEIFCELGVVVGILFLIYIIILFLQTFIHYIKDKNNNLLQLLFYIFAYLLFNAMISGDLNDSRLLFIFMSLLSIKELRYVNNL